MRCPVIGPSCLLLLILELGRCSYWKIAGRTGDEAMTIRTLGSRSVVRVLLIVAVVVLAGSGCTSHSAGRSLPPTVEAPLSAPVAERPNADRACAAHFARFTLAQESTVEFVAGGGPRPVPYVPPHIDSFGPHTPITLCLVPVGSAEFDVMAITPDGATHRQWQQDDAKHIYPLG